MKEASRKHLRNALTPLDVRDVEHMSLRCIEVIARAENGSLSSQPTIITYVVVQKIQVFEGLRQHEGWHFRLQLAVQHVENRGKPALLFTRVLALPSSSCSSAAPESSFPSEPSRRFRTRYRGTSCSRPAPVAADSYLSRRSHSYFSPPWMIRFSDTEKNSGKYPK